MNGAPAAITRTCWASSWGPAWVAGWCWRASSGRAGARPVRSATPWSSPPTSFRPSWAIWPAPWGRPSWPGAEERLAPAGLPLVADDGPEQEQAAAEGQREADDRQGRVTQDPDRRLHAHQQGGAHDQSRENQPHRDPVGDLVQARHQPRLVDGVHLDLQLVVGDRVQDAVDAPRHLLHEIAHLDRARKQAAG